METDLHCDPIFNPKITNSEALRSIYSLSSQCLYLGELVHSECKNAVLCLAPSRWMVKEVECGTAAKAVTLQESAMSL